MESHRENQNVHLKPVIVFASFIWSQWWEITVIGITTFQLFSDISNKVNPEFTVYHCKLGLCKLNICHVCFMFLYMYSHPLIQCLLIFKWNLSTVPFILNMQYFKFMTADLTNHTLNSRSRSDRIVWFVWIEYFVAANKVISGTCSMAVKIGSNLHLSNLKKTPTTQRVIDGNLLRGMNPYTCN